MFTTILGLLAIIADAYETWHLVDLAQVVCPKPTSSDPDAPEFPDYTLGINYTGELQLDAPHIVGFIRASGQAVSITFKIEDSDGEQVVPETTVELQEGSDAVPSTCKCVYLDESTPGVPAGFAATYGALAADMAMERSMLAVECEWCCRRWCYASAECPDAYASQAIPGQYFSTLASWQPRLFDQTIAVMWSDQEA
eukprot:Skav217329  [mRNA]  locus=scaffold2460:128236:131691:- [translate_table: standard]